MKYRRATILAEKAVTVNTTETIDINLEDIISSIYIRIRGKNGSDAPTPAGHPAGFATKIELVDGSDVLFSLDGYQIQALNYYDRLVTPHTEISDGGGDDQLASFLLDFGRYLYDTELALDPKRFRNLQLKITNDWDLVDANAASGYVKVEADVFDEKVVSPMGFLMSKVIEQYTMTGSAAYKYIDIPTDHPFRKLLCRSFLTNIPPNGAVDEFRISEDNDKRVPFDVDVDHYLHSQFGTLLPITEHFTIRLSTTLNSAYVMPTYWPFIMGHPHTALAAIQRQTYHAAERQGLLADNPSSIAANLIAFGYVPHHTLCFPFGDQKDLDDWYDVTAKGSVRARLLSHSSACVTSLFGQQLRRY